MIPNFGVGLLQARAAALLAIAPAATLAPLPPDTAGMTLAWSSVREALVAPPVAGRSTSVRIADLTLGVGRESFALPGRTWQDGMAWLEERHGRPLRPPRRDVAASPLARGGEFVLADELEELAILLERADAALHTLGLRARIRPLRFEAVVRLDVSEHRFVEAGMSPCLPGLRGPHWFVAPTPSPAKTGHLPRLSQGWWHTEGSIVAVLPARRRGAPFLAEAVAMAGSLLERVVRTRRSTT